MASINGLGPRPNFNTNNSAPISYPQLNKATGVDSGRGADAASMDNLGLNPGAQGDQQNALQQVLQVVVQLLQSLLSMFGLGQQSQGGDQAGGAPGVGGASNAGGDANMWPDLNKTLTPGGDTGGNANMWPDLTGGPTQPNAAGAAGAVGSPQAPTGGGQVPWISQYSPAGAANGYSNGAANCGPTSMAMIARSMGYGAGMSDAQLISQLGQVGGTGPQGTSINGIVAMAHQIGANAEIHGPQADLNWIDQSLAAGKNVVANGNYYDEPGHGSGSSGHYLDVVGKTADGNYVIRDPADQNEQVFTPQQLAQFINGNPVNGGYCVAIG